MTKIDRSKVAIGVPMERNVHQDAFHYFIEIARGGYPWLHLPYCRNDIARNKLAAAALQGGFEWVIQLDSDHKHPPDIVERLLRWPEQDPSIRIVGGLNFRRGEPYDPCAFIIGDDGRTYSLVDWEQGLIEVSAIGTGSLAIHTSVFEDIDFPWFGYNYASVLDVDSTYPGTDIWFCQKVRAAGIKMYVDTTTSSPHHYDNWITEQTYRSFMRANKERVANSVGYSQVVKTTDTQEVRPLGPKCIEQINELLGDGGTILELGSGEGTGRLAEKYSMISVEHDKAYLGKHNSDYIHAAIVPNGRHDWYNHMVIKNNLKGKKYDLLLVDGPPGHIGRLGMLDHLDLFDLSVPIIVDDVQRSAEHFLMTELSKKTGRNSRVFQDGDKSVGIIV